MARDFSWTELLASLAGGAAGGIGGFLVGGPVGAISGAGLGWGIGQQLSPGGFWSETPAATPTPIGRPALGADLENAAKAEERAIQSNVGQQLAQALRGSRIDAAQRGFYRSGEQGQREDALRQAAMRSVAGAVAGSRLEATGLENQLQIAEMNYELQRAQFQSQLDAAKNAMYGQLAMAAGQLLPDIIGRFWPSEGGTGGVPGMPLPEQLPFNPQPNTTYPLR